MPGCVKVLRTAFESELIFRDDDVTKSQFQAVERDAPRIGKLINDRRDAVTFLARECYDRACMCMRSASVITCKVLVPIDRRVEHGYFH